MHAIRSKTHYVVGFVAAVADMSVALFEKVFGIIFV